ncbi:MAG: DUF3035 domain-containing protein [Pseudomonadota bacterium]|nr:DUF3035 domain-containing protein [Pseudomonadota bacterium]MEE3101279.1 DUF3035 domain-containing protein [Pseudomonadota bacterium]
MAINSIERAPRILLLVAAACVALSGCAGGRRAVGDAFGLTVDSPNAFNVSPRAPLRLPSDFASLPAPQPGAPSPLEPRPEAEARAALAAAGAPATGGSSPSPGELALLGAAGSDQADPAIRPTLEAEVDASQTDQYGLSSLFGYKVPDGTERETLDPRTAAEEVREQGALTPTPAPLPPETPSGTYVLPVNIP